MTIIMEPQLSQSHVTLVLSSAYTECAARLPHLSIIRNQLLPHHHHHHICMSQLKRDSVRYASVVIVFTTQRQRYAKDVQKVPF